MKTYVCYERIENIEKQLDDKFYHTLKKLVVNLEKVSVMIDQKVIFQNGSILYVGQRKLYKRRNRYPQLI